MNWYQHIKESNRPFLLDIAQHQQVIQMYLPLSMGGKNMTNEQIANTFKINPGVISYLMRKHFGNSLKDIKKKKFSEGLIDSTLQIINLYKPQTEGGEGLSVPEIAKKLNITKLTVRRALQRRNMLRPEDSTSVQKRLGLMDKDIDDLYLRYIDGESIQNLADQLGIHNNSLSIMFTNLGYKRKSKSEATKESWDQRGDFWNDWLAKFPIEKRIAIINGMYSSLIRKKDEKATPGFLAVLHEKARQLDNDINLRPPVPLITPQSSNWYQRAEIKSAFDWKLLTKAILATIGVGSSVIALAIALDIRPQQAQKIVTKHHSETKAVEQEIQQLSTSKGFTPLTTKQPEISTKINTEPQAQQNSIKINNPDIFVARVVFAETANTSDTERELVASVIFNRMKHKGFGQGKLNSFNDVVKQSGAFEAINDPNNKNWELSQHIDRMNSKEKHVWEHALYLSHAAKSKNGPSGRPLVYYHDKSIKMPKSWNNKYWRAVKEIETPHFIFYSIIRHKKLTKI